MMHVPAHKNLQHPPSQIVNPIGSNVKTIGDYVAQVQALDNPATAMPLAKAARMLEIAATNYQRKVSRREVDPTPASIESLRSAGLILADSLVEIRRSLRAAGETTLPAHNLRVA